MSRERITERILRDAERYAGEKVAGAKRRAEEILAAARAEEAALRAERARERARTERENEQRLASMSEAEMRFARLNMRQEAADSVFRLAAEKLCSLDRERAEAFWGALLERYGEEGDEVIFSSGEKTLGPAFVQALSERCGRKFSAGAAGGRFAGGMMLRSAYCDKNLTVEMLVREYREEREGSVLEMLFGAS